MPGNTRADLSSASRALVPPGWGLTYAREHAHGLAICLACLLPLGLGARYARGCVRTLTFALRTFVRVNLNSEDGERRFDPRRRTPLRPEEDNGPSTRRVERPLSSN